MESLVSSHMGAMRAPIKPAGKRAAGGILQEQVSEEQEKDDPEVANKARKQKTHNGKDILLF